MTKSRRNYVKGFVLFLVPAVLFTILDQYSKLLAVRYLKNSASLVLIDGALSLSYLENTGAAFGILNGRQWIFVIAAAVMMLASLIISFRIDREIKTCSFVRSVLHIALGCLFAGALGNMIDRLARGCVIDFIYFSLIDFPVFNVADICVTCSVAVIAVIVIFFYGDSDAGSEL